MDLFAGGGGVSAGYKIATGMEVDIAVNHDEAAVAMHKANHRRTLHYCESVYVVDPKKACSGRKVGFLWLSPDCTYFSVALGGKPIERGIRALAWVGVKWAIAVRPRVIFLENVPEFQDWGPLDENNKPIKERKGETFKAFIATLTTGLDPDHPAWPEIMESLGEYFDKKQLVNGLGYDLEYRTLVACDYGAATSRERLFLAARCDGKSIKWPEPTHGDPKSAEVADGKLKPWKTAAEIIDFTLPAPSIFDTAAEIKEKYNLRAKRPLAPKTMKRTALGLDKFFIKNPEPYIIQVNHGGDNFRGQSIHEPMPTLTVKHGYGIVAPVLMQYHDSTEARGQTVDRPLMTIDTSPRYALQTVFLSKYYGQGIGQKVTDPVHTITTRDREGITMAYIQKFYKTGTGQDVNEPLHTITTSAGHFGLVNVQLAKATQGQNLLHWPEVRDLLNQYCGYQIKEDEVLIFDIDGIWYFISDIGLRMFTPRELFNAQGFPPDYIIDVDYYGNSYPRSEQVARCGHSVSPPTPAALIRANMPEICMHVEDWNEYDRMHRERQMSLF